jgi:AcrR family transcriptional regulator
MGRRRSGEEARRAILLAAERRLRAGGPEAVRLQEVAADLGLSHPAILHHFGSRDGMMRALADHVAARLEGELRAALRDAPSRATVRGLVERVFETLGGPGQARLLAWRALAAESGTEPGTPPDARARRRRRSRPASPAAAAGAEPTAMLGAIAGLVHARRREYARAHGAASPPREDSEFVVRLAAAAMLGEGVAGGVFDRSLGRAGGGAERARLRFRAWFARLLLAHLEISPRRRAPRGSSRARAAHPRSRGRRARR